MLSVIVPVLNEQDNLAPLHEELAKIFQDREREVEFVFVDDGSSDESLHVLQELRARDARVRVLELTRQSGQSAALWAGICAARGDVLASLDADRQYDTTDVLRFWEKLQANGADMVCAWRQCRADSVLKQWASRFANEFRRTILKDNIRDAGCTLRVWKKQAVDGITAFDGFHRFLPVLCYLAGKKVEQMGVTHKPRQAGRSHYGIWRRAGLGFVDTVGVRWLGKRKIWVGVKEL